MTTRMHTYSPYSQLVHMLMLRNFHSYYISYSAVMAVESNWCRQVKWYNRELLNGWVGEMNGGV